MLLASMAQLPARKKRVAGNVSAVAAASRVRARSSCCLAAGPEAVVAHLGTTARQRVQEAANELQAGNGTRSCWLRLSR